MTHFEGAADMKHFEAVLFKKNTHTLKVQQTGLFLKMTFSHLTIPIFCQLESFIFENNCVHSTV